MFLVCEVDLAAISRTQQRFLLSIIKCKSADDLFIALLYKLEMENRRLQRIVFSFVFLLFYYQ